MMKSLQISQAKLSKTNLQKMSKTASAYQKGSILLEALIAILIFSFGILAISGLQGAMMKNTADATYRSEASYLVQQQVGQMLINPAVLASGSISAPSLPGGSIAISQLTLGRVNFTVTWRVPGELDNAGNQIVHNYQAVSSVFPR